MLRLVTVPAAGSSNEEESGSESGDADEREPAEPSSPAGKTASAASSDGMDAEVRHPLRRAWSRLAMQFSWLLPSAACFVGGVPLDVRHCLWIILSVQLLAVRKAVASNMVTWKVNASKHCAHLR